MSSVFILIISTLCFQWICITFTSHFCESKLSLWMEKSFSLVEASIFASHFHVLRNEPLDLDSEINLGWTVLESLNEDRKGLFTTWTVSTISFRWLSCWWTGLKPFDAVILQWTNPEWTPSGVGVRSQNMDELLATVTIENELLNEGGCSSRLVHYSQCTIGKILHSIELPTRLNESHWMWEFVPATECVA